MSAAPGFDQDMPASLLAGQRVRVAGREYRFERRPRARGRGIPRRERRHEPCGRDAIADHGRRRASRLARRRVNGLRSTFCRCKSFSTRKASRPSRWWTELRARLRGNGDRHAVIFFMSLCKAIVRTLPMLRSRQHRGCQYGWRGPPKNNRMGRRIPLRSPHTITNMIYKRFP